MKTSISFLFFILMLTIGDSCIQTESNEKMSGIDRLIRMTDRELSGKDSLGRSFLHLATIENDTAAILYLIKQGLSPNQKDDSGYTSLHYAVKYRKYAALKLLVENGADISVDLPDTCSVLMFAIQHNDVLSTEILFLRNSNNDYEIKEGNENYKLGIEAIRRKNYPIAELFINPMHYIVKRDKVEYFDHLASADKRLIKSRDEKKMTPLHIAYLYQNERFIGLLRSAGAVDTIDIYGKKPEEYRFDNFLSMTSLNALDDHVRAKLDDRMYDFLMHHKWMTLGVIVDGKIVYLRSYGNENMVDRDAVHASVSKPMTSLIFFQLFRKGLIKSLDDPISDYSTKYRDVMPSAYARDKITFRHILTHTSGIPHINKPLWVNNRLNLLFQPGTRFEYSTNAYGVLGEIMEEVTGESFSELVVKYIGQPISAHSFWAEDEFRAPAARIHSTTRDFAGFAEAIINHKYITETEFYDTLIGKKQEESLGWGTSGIGTDDLMVGHSGSNGKPRSHFLIKPRKKIAVVLMGETKDARDDIWFLYLAPILIDIIEGKKGF